MNTSCRHFPSNAKNVISSLSLDQKEPGSCFGKMRKTAAILKNGKKWGQTRMASFWRWGFPGTEYLRLNAEYQ